MDEVLKCDKCGSDESWIVGTGGIRCKCGEWPSFEAEGPRQIRPRLEVKDPRLISDYNISRSAS